MIIFAVALFIRHYTNFYTVTDLNIIITEFDFYLIVWGFHGTFATGAVRLLFRTPGPVPFGIGKCSFVETTDPSSYITPSIHDPFIDLTSYRIWHLSLIWHHQFMTLSQILLLTEFEITEYRFAWGICYGCVMPTGDAYSSGHLVLSHFWTCMCFNVETNLCWTCLVFGDLSFEHPSVLLFWFITITRISIEYFYKLWKLVLIRNAPVYLVHIFVFNLVFKLSSRWQRLLSHKFAIRYSSKIKFTFKIFQTASMRVKLCCSLHLLLEKIRSWWMFE